MCVCVLLSLPCLMGVVLFCRQETNFDIFVQQKIERKKKQRSKNIILMRRGKIFVNKQMKSCFGTFNITNFFLFVLLYFLFNLETSDKKCCLLTEYFVLIFVGQKFYQRGLIRVRCTKRIILPVPSTILLVNLQSIFLNTAINISNLNCHINKAKVCKINQNIGQFNE